MFINVYTMNNVIIGTSTFRLRLDEEFRDSDKLMERIDFEMSIDKDLAYKTILKCTEQDLYVFFYRAVVLLLIGLVILFIPFIYNLNVLLFSGISIITIILSLYFFMKFSNLKSSFKMTVNMIYSMYMIHYHLKDKNPE